MEIEYLDEREFAKWMRGLDVVSRGRIAGKIEFVAALGGSLTGMPLVRSLRDDLFEIRVAQFRIYFTEYGALLLVLTAGVKDTQDRDIDRARRRMP